jgi:hypothetical protein
MGLLQRLRRAIRDDLADSSVTDLDKETMGLPPLWLTIDAVLGFVAVVVAFVACLYNDSMSLLRGDFPKPTFRERSAVEKVASVLISSLACLLVLGLLIAPTVGMLSLMYCAALWGPQ